MTTPDDPIPDCSWSSIVFAIAAVSVAATIVFGFVGCRRSISPPAVRRPEAATQGPGGAGEDCPGGTCVLPRPTR